jgi:hypothetical protein
MVTRVELREWIVDAIRSRGGASNVVGVAKDIWDAHEQELRDSGDRFYTWQYDIRWVAKRLRDQGVLKPVHDSKTLPWELVEQKNP